MQRWIWLASLWLANPSGACFLSVIEQSEHNDNDKTRLVQKIHIPKLSATHPWTCKGRFVQRHYDLYNVQEHVSCGLLNMLITIVRLPLSRKIKFQSCLPLTTWSCKGRFVQHHYDLHIVQEHVFLGLLNHLNMMVRFALSRKITSQSCLPLTPRSCKGRFVWPHCDL